MATAKILSYHHFCRNECMKNFLLFASSNILLLVTCSYWRNVNYLCQLPPVCRACIMSYLMPCHIAITLQVVSCVWVASKFLLLLYFVYKGCRPIKQLQLQWINKSENPHTPNLEYTIFFFVSRKRNVRIKPFKWVNNACIHSGAFWRGEGHFLIIRTWCKASPYRLIPWFFLKGTLK